MVCNNKQKENERKKAIYLLIDRCMYNENDISPSFILCERI